MADDLLTVKPTTETQESTTCDGTTVSDGNPYVLAWHVQLFYAAAFVAMLVVAIAGNAVVVWIVVAHRRMRNVTNYFLVNLSLADGLQSVFNTLFNFVYLLHNDWKFGYMWCIFAQFSAPCTISASVFTFIAIALDRYVTSRCTTESIYLPVLLPFCEDATIIAVVLLEQCYFIALASCHCYKVSLI